MKILLNDFWVVDMPIKSVSLVANLADIESVFCSVSFCIVFVFYPLVFSRSSFVTIACSSDVFLGAGNDRIRFASTWNISNSCE